MIVSVVIIWDIGGNYLLYQIYLLIPLFSCNPILALVEAVFFHDVAASNQRLPAPLAEKENQDIKHTNCKDVVSS